MCFVLLFNNLFFLIHKAFTVEPNAGVTMSTCFEKCRGVKTLVNHIKTHERDVKSPLLAFMKRVPAKKSVTIAIKKVKEEPLQVKRTFSKFQQKSSLNTDKACPQARNPNP